MIESLKIISVVIIAILKKDLLQERRTKETFIPILIFGMLVILIFGFAVNPSPVVLASIAPGLVWVAFVLAGFLAANRSLVIEIQEETIDLLLLALFDKSFESRPTCPQISTMAFWYFLRHQPISHQPRRYFAKHLW